MSILALMVQNRMMLILYSYNMNIYFLPLLEFTGNLPVRYVTIFLLGSKILVNNMLVHCSSGVIGGSSCLLGFYDLEDLSFLLVFFICILVVAIDGGR